MNDPSNNESSADDWDEEEIVESESAANPASERKSPSVQLGKVGGASAPIIAKRSTADEKTVIRKKKRKKPSPTNGKEEQEWGEKRKKSRANEGAGKAIATGLLVLAAVGAGIFFAFKYLKAGSAEAPVVIDTSRTDYGQFENDPTAPTEEELLSRERELIQRGAGDPTSEDWFAARMSTLPRELSSILVEIGDGKDQEILKKYLRKPEESLTLMPKYDDFFSPPMVLDRLDQWTVTKEDNGSRSYVGFSGKRSDGSPFLCYFVGSDEGLKLDWQASVAVSDFSVEELIEERPEGEHLLRARVSDNVVFVDGFTDEKEWGSWDLVSADGLLSLWSYAPLASQMHTDLSDWLQRGVFLAEMKDEVRATLRVRPAGSGRFPRVYEIVGIEHRGWVAP